MTSPDTQRPVFQVNAKYSEALINDTELVHHDDSQSLEISKLINQRSTYYAQTWDKNGSKNFQSFTPLSGQVTDRSRGTPP